MLGSKSRTNGWGSYITCWSGLGHQVLSASHSLHLLQDPSSWRTWSSTLNSPAQWARLSFPMESNHLGCLLLYLWDHWLLHLIPLSPLSSPPYLLTWHSSVWPCLLWTLQDVSVSGSVFLHTYKNPSPLPYLGAVIFSPFPFLLFFLLFQTWDLVFTSIFILFSSVNFRKTI